MQSHWVRLLRPHYEGIRIKKKRGGEGNMKPWEREKEGIWCIFFQGFEMYVNPHSTRDTANAHRQTSTQTCTPQVCQGAGERKCGRGSVPWLIQKGLTLSLMERVKFSFTVEFNKLNDGLFSWNGVSGLTDFTELKLSQQVKGPQNSLCHCLMTIISIYLESCFFFFFWKLIEQGRSSGVQDDKTWKQVKCGTF